MKITVGSLYITCFRPEPKTCYILGYENGMVSYRYTGEDHVYTALDYAFSQTRRRI